MLQEVTRREAAEQEVSEAQGYLNSSRQELGELKHLAWKLEQMGRNRCRLRRGWGTAPFERDWQHRRHRGTLLPPKLSHWPQSCFFHNSRQHPIRSRALLCFNEGDGLLTAQTLLCATTCHFCAVHSVARIDAKNQAIEQLEGQLHVRGGRCPAVAAVAAGETDGRSGDKIREYRDQNCSKKSYQGANTRGDVKKAVRSAAHCSQLLAFSSGESGQQAMLAALSELRSDLQCMNTQVLLELLSKKCGPVEPLLPRR